ncbi:uncharacterized protein TRAVEDRAFT_20164 [Trametes versicolor FP-101664 SS1]|uniref:uncharacterized protein n=1 Tax=Trametes versicolor (strain FP-101664) TaxID=717944 RepID=UPI0004623ADA|nr:uncharacterized protein TRAVEDRAFT_20164 [Trametes versicolor FP-101664 SS1]EIW59898.1 hypothetical protein TRAVEDRAFT_20164 [Trametes versicolor FP-101664 SS1]
MRYPEILAHKCVRLRDCFRFHYGATDTLESGDAYTRTVNSLGRLPQDRPQVYWPEGSTGILTNHPFRFNPFHDADSEARQPAKAMRQLVSALGLDPARATFDVLEWHHMRGWDPAKQRIPEWRRADEQAMAQVRASLASVQAVRVGTSRLWCCSLCPTFDAVATLMVPHLKERHSIDDPEAASRDGTIFLHPSEVEPPLYLNRISLRDFVEIPQGSVEK